MAPSPARIPDRTTPGGGGASSARRSKTMTRSLSVVLEYDFFDQNSNYQFYKFNDHAVTLGLRAAL